MQQKDQAMNDMNDMKKMQSQTNGTAPTSLSEEDLKNIAGGSEIHGVEDEGSIVGYIHTGGKVENLKSDGCEIHGVEFVGGLVGTAKGGKIHD